MTRPTRHTFYEAIAQFGGRPAGFVCYGWTKQACREKALQLTRLNVIVRRTDASEAAVDALRRVGKL